MPRAPREISDSSYYHVLVRGNGKQKIFVDDEDKKKILQILKDYSDDDLLKIIAYCILDTHAHFLLKIEKYDISTIMKKINITYAYYYNCKYQRTGHVFYDRFKSTCIRDKQYILPIIRFIHNDPINNGIVQKHDAYKWSSYKDYIETDDDTIIFYKKTILGQFDSNTREAVHKFKVYTKTENKDLFLDIRDSIENKINRMLEIYLSKNDIKLSELGYKQNKHHRIHLVLMLKNTGKLSIRKIGEMLQLNRGVVYKIIKEHSREDESK